MHRSIYVLWVLFNLLIGPFQLATGQQLSWEQVPIPEGGSFLTLEAGPSGILYATTHHSIYRSINQGQTWETIHDGILPSEIHSFVISKEEDLFVVTNGGTFSWMFNALFYSKDKGDSWEEIDLPFSSNQVGGIDVDAQGDIWLGTHYNELYRSTNEGLAWERIETNELFGVGYHGLLKAMPDGTLFSTTNTMFRSTDKGNTWELAHSGLVSDHYQFFFDLIRHPSGALFTRSTNGLFRSLNNGSSWEPVSATGESQPGGSGAYVTDIDITPEGNLLAFLGGIGLAQSSDLGDTWEPVIDSTQANIGSATLTQLAVSPDGILYGTAGPLVYSSEDQGNTWATHQTGLREWNIHSIPTYQDYLFIGAAPLNGIYRSADQGATWTHFDEGFDDTSASTMQVNKDGVLFAASRISGIYRSEDLGETWVPIREGMLEPENDHITIIELTVFGNQLYAKTNRGRYISHDAGDSWVPSPYSFHLTDIVQRTDGSLLAHYLSRLYDSNDEGQTWKEVENSINLEVRSLATTEQNIIYAGTRTKMLRSNDGRTWEALNTTPSFTNDLAINSLGHLFVSTEDSVYYSKDEGKSWNTLNQGLRGLPLHTLTITDSGYLFGATYRAGLIRTTLSTEPNNVSTDIPGDLPESLSLAPAYPNPLQGSAQIQFELPTRMQATLRVYNTLGQQITVLAEGMHEAGSHTYVFSSEGLPSGVYFYRLEAGSQRTTQKVLVVR